MVAKKATGTAASATKKSAAAAPSHPSYQDMIKEAIIALKDRNGSSRQAIKKYVLGNFTLNATDAAFTTQFNKAIQRGTDNGAFSRPKGPSGTVKLAKPTPTATTKTAAPKTAKAAGAKKATTAKKPVAKKDTTKAAPKKAVAKKDAAPKKTTAAKPKANTGKARKASTDVPAVTEKPAVVTGKTKSGRVTKTKAPQAAAKKAAPKKKAAAPKKAVAAKKA